MTLPANMPAESIALGLAVLELLALIVEKYKASHDPDHNPFSRNFSGDVTIRLPYSELYLCDVKQYYTVVNSINNLPAKLTPYCVMLHYFTVQQCVQNYHLEQNT